MKKEGIKVDAKKSLDVHIRLRNIHFHMLFALRIKSDALYWPDLRALKRHNCAKARGAVSCTSFLVILSTSSYVIPTRANLCQDKIDANQK